MPEIALTLNLSDLQAQVAYFMFGQDDLTRIAPFELRRLDQAIKNGLRRFYYPAQVDPQLLHDWSFLRAKLTVKINTGLSDYLMPFDFGGSEGDLVHDPNDNVRVPVRKLTVEQILRFRSLLIMATSWPRFYAERAVHQGGRESTRWELMFWPDPGAAYILYGTYRVLPLAPGSGQPYLYGGPEHSQTILEACLAAAELIVDGQPGPHSAEFMNCLRTSVMMDQTTHQPEYLGYNGDQQFRGKNPLMRDDMHFENFAAVTLQGQTPG